MAIGKRTLRISGVNAVTGRDMSLRNGSRFTEADELLIETSSYAAKLELLPMRDLDLMIKNGYGNTPQMFLPKDWRTVKRNGTKA